MSHAPRGSPWLPARRAALHAALLCASSAPLRAVEDGASCVADVAADDAIVADTAEFLPEKERTRLVRILRTGEQQTGVKLRVLTRSRASDDWAYDPRAIRCRLGLEAVGLDVIVRRLAVHGHARVRAREFRPVLAVAQAGQR